MPMDRGNWITTPTAAFRIVAYSADHSNSRDSMHLVERTGTRHGASQPQGEGEGVLRTHVEQLRWNGLLGRTWDLVLLEPAPLVKAKIQKVDTWGGKMGVPGSVGRE